MYTIAQSIDYKAPQHTLLPEGMDTVDDSGHVLTIVQVSSDGVKDLQGL